MLPKFQEKILSLSSKFNRQSEKFFAGFLALGYEGDR